MSGICKITIKTHSGRTCKISGEKGNQMTEDDRGKYDRMGTFGCNPTAP